MKMGLARLAEEPADPGEDEGHSIQQLTDFYDLGRTLGAGNRSLVRAAASKTTNTMYAVKIIERDAKKLTDVAILAEMELLQSMNHPNITSIRELFIEPMRYCLVTEFVSGERLIDRIAKTNTHSDKDVRDIVRVLLDALAYCHSKNVVHGHLTLRNVLVATDISSIKLTGFSISSDRSPRSGSAEFVAPEMMEGDRYGKPGDVWSLGIIACLLLVGSTPFSIASQLELVGSDSEGEYKFDSPFWDEVSQDAKDCIGRMLVVDPRQRATAAELLQHKWITTEHVATVPLANTLANLRTRFTSPPTASSSTSVQLSDSDDDSGYGDEDSDKKKKRRRQQVRYVSRRRRKMEKDEESYLRERVEELTEQARVIGVDLPAQHSLLIGSETESNTARLQRICELFEGFIASRDAYSSSSVWTDPVWVALTATGKTLDLRLGKLVAQSEATQVWRSRCGQYALKALRGIPSMTAVAAFARLVMTAASLHHPRIARPVAVVGDAASALRVVTAFAEYGDLRSLLRATTAADSEQSDLGWAEEKSVIALDVAEALVYLHSSISQDTAVKTAEVVVVGDLHAGHVLVDRDGHARVNLVSFATACNASREKDAFPYWSAPEVLHGGVATVAADVFAFGVLLCELDTGVVPYSAVGLSPMELQAAVASGELRPSVSDACPPRIQQLASECMAVDPLHRPHATQIAYRLRDIIKNDL